MLQNKLFLAPSCLRRRESRSEINSSTGDGDAHEAGGGGTQFFYVNLNNAMHWVLGTTLHAAHALGAIFHAANVLGATSQAPKWPNPTF